MLRYVKKTDYYEPDCLRVMQSSLHRYLTEMNMENRLLVTLNLQIVTEFLKEKSDHYESKVKGTTECKSGINGRI